jgi:hypothetical protein
MSQEAMKAELESLRTEVESYRQRELEDLRSQLAAAREAAEHYRNEAHRNAEAGRNIHIEAQETISKLRAQLDAKDRLMRAMNRRADAQPARN